MERCTQASVLGGYFEGFLDGVFTTGEANGTSIIGATAKDCLVNFQIRLTTALCKIVNCTSIAGAETSYGIRVIAGLVEDPGTTADTYALVQGNTCLGINGQTAGSFAGSQIQIQSGTASVGNPATAVPHLVKVLDNTVLEAGRDGIVCLEGVDCEIRGNTVARVPGRGIYAINASRLTIADNRVLDAGQDAGAAAYSLDDCTDVTFRGNRGRRKIAGSLQAYGLELIDTCTFREFFGNELDGVTGEISGTVVPIASPGPQLLIGTPISSVRPVYADNAAAVGGGLAVNSEYQTATGEVRVVV